MSHALQSRLQPLLLAALLAAGAATAFAQSAPPAATGATQAQAQTAPRAHHGMRHDQRDPAKMQQFMAKRQAELKAKLQIEPAQEAAWTTFSEAVKPSADAFKRRQEMHAEMQKLTTPERIDRMRTLRTERQARMDKRGDAVKTFYSALNAEQKKTFDNQPLMQGRGGRNGRGGEHGPRHGRMHSDMGDQAPMHGGKHGAMHGNMPAPDKS